MDGPPGTRKGTLYDGTDAAVAMAAFSKAITEGRLYVTLEALRLARSAGPTMLLSSLLRTEADRWP
jgi:hypothetical protein